MMAGEEIFFSLESSRMSSMFPIPLFSILLDVAKVSTGLLEGSQQDPRCSSMFAQIAASGYRYVQDGLKPLSIWPGRSVPG